MNERSEREPSFASPPIVEGATYARERPWVKGRGFSLSDPARSTSCVMDSLASFVRRVLQVVDAARSSSSPRARLAVKAGVPVLVAVAFLLQRRSKAAGAAIRELPREIPISSFLKLVKMGAIRWAAVGAGGAITACVTMDDLPTASAPTTAVVHTEMVNLPPKLQETLLDHDVVFYPQRPGVAARFIGAAIVIAPLAYAGFLSYMIWRMVADVQGGAGPAQRPEGAAPDEIPSVSFDDIAGMANAKAQVMEVCDCLRRPERYAVAGARCPRGVLLIGPPGTGKTMLARAIASTAHASFFACSGSDFVEMYVGRGASRVRRVFERARAAAPCVIFIDEFDTLGRRRVVGNEHACEEHEQTVNALLAEMDGFSPTSGVCVVAATNRFEILDSALTRPGMYQPLRPCASCAASHGPALPVPRSLRPRDSSRAPLERRASCHHQRAPEEGEPCAGRGRGSPRPGHRWLFWCGALQPGERGGPPRCAAWERDGAQQGPHRQCRGIQAIAIHSTARCRCCLSRCCTPRVGTDALLAAAALGDTRQRCGVDGILLAWPCFCD